ncbi:hypothetical protein BK816_01495 [Boudabousia tangfeifanii]|uniref:THAP4-like heme-binding beta-barrel domain-containing protein n=1 Tax=Boudabousia tangfeifanii TaxID=1912795 RepID=A0A1D9MIM5_9ACTO|nr:hypothetical protein [Boudabousia tangfeifanii]AOZ72132.1 hypothetical protein BK816_01495 [Boudabousia tangfeifanii]
MITIPANLPEKLLPLAWMLGNWRGYGAWLPAGPQALGTQSLQVLVHEEELFFVWQWQGANGFAQPQESAQAGSAKLTPVGNRFARWQRLQVQAIHAETNPVQLVFTATDLVPPQSVATTLAEDENAAWPTVEELATWQSGREWSGVMVPPRGQWQSLGAGEENADTTLVLPGASTVAPEALSANQDEAENPARDYALAESFGTDGSGGRIRMFGLVDSELMWNELAFSAKRFTELTAAGQSLGEDDLVPVATGRLAQVDESLVDLRKPWKEEK